MNKIKLAYIIIIASTILLVLNLYYAYTDNEFNYFVIASNVLIIIAMIIIIYNRRNKTEQL